MTRALIVLLPVTGFLVWALTNLWVHSEGYLSRTRARDRRRDLELERIKAENEIAIETARWQAQTARADFDRTRARMIAQADTDPGSPLRTVI